MNDPSNDVERPESWAVRLQAPRKSCTAPATAVGERFREVNTDQTNTTSVAKYSRAINQPHDMFKLRCTDLLQILPHKLI